MRRLALVFAVACSSSKHAPPAPACDLSGVARAPMNARPQLVIESCPVCDFKTILAWNVEGTRPEALQKALESCNAFCNGDAKMKFIAAVDKAKGTSSDTPWRRLADACGERVDASSDHRFMSASYFAIDRIARAHGKDLAGIDIPLPPLTVAGTGVVLPQVDGTKDSAPGYRRDAITIIGDDVFVGIVPHASLTEKGIVPDLGDPAYPGKQVALAELATTLAKSDGILLLAPHAMPAQKLVPVVQAAAPVVKVYLAVASTESPVGWDLADGLPYPLQVGEGGISVTPEMTVQQLANEIVAKQSGTLHE